MGYYDRLLRNSRCQLGNQLDSGISNSIRGAFAKKRNRRNEMSEADMGLPMAGSPCAPPGMDGFETFNPD